jgi:O-antigen ligase
MDADVFGNLTLLCGGCFGVLFLIFWIASMVWVYKDSQDRGKTGCLWLLLVGFTWPFGLLAYYLLRDKEVKL